jgi:NAD(P)-dependent dehydrogenase (short-subunit alcohol dehydrogenase family)
MAKVLAVCGYGPGISHAVAQRFAAEGYQVALLARGAEKLEKGAALLRAGGAKVQAFPCDLGDLAAVRATFAKVKATLGPVTVVHWNAASIASGGDLTRDGVEGLRASLEVGVFALVTAVQETLADLRAQHGAVLVTGGGFSAVDPGVDSIIAKLSLMGLGLTKSAQHKLVGMLNARLKGEGVFVGEVLVTGTVKGTAFDTGTATLEASTVADTFWQLAQSRADVCVRVG